MLGPKKKENVTQPTTTLLSQQAHIQTPASLHTPASRLMIDELLPIIAEPLRGAWRPLGRLLCISKSFYSNATLQTLYQTAMEACCDARPELASYFLGELKERYTFTRTFGGGEFERRKQVIRHYDVSDSSLALHRMVLEFSDSFWFGGQRIAEIKAQPRPGRRPPLCAPKGAAEGGEGAGYAGI